MADACQVGDKLFWGFTYSSLGTGGAVAPTAAQVTITADSSNPLEPGLIFASSLWSVNGTASGVTNLLVDSSIGFNVTTISGQAFIADASISFAATTSGTAVAGIGESVSPAGQPTLNLSLDTTAGIFSAQKNFRPVNSLEVSKDLFVIVPAPSIGNPPNTGSSTITSFREGFSEVPEPVGAFLIGSGLLALSLFRRGLNRR